MAIQFKIDSERLSWDDLEAVEAAGEGKRPVHTLKVVMAKVMQGDDGDYLPQAEAEAALGALSIAQMSQAIADFTAALKELQAATVPPARSGK